MCTYFFGQGSPHRSNLALVQGPLVGSSLAGGWFASELMPVRPHHAPIQRPVTGNEDEFDPIGDLRGCAEIYEKMQLCLADNERDWVRCQKVVQQVKQCMEQQAGPNDAVGRGE